MRRASIIIALSLARAAFAEGEEPAKPAEAPPAAAPAPAPAAPAPAAPAAPVESAAGSATQGGPAGNIQPAGARAPANRAGAGIQPAVANVPAAPGAKPPTAPGAPRDPKAAIDAARANPHLPPGMSVNEHGEVVLPSQPIPMTGLPNVSIDDERLVLTRAKLVFGSLLLGDPRPLVEASAFPFMLEDRRIGSSEELYQEWQRQLRQKRPDLLTLYGVELLTPADMEKKYGKPPARLSGLPAHGAGRSFYVVANLSGHAAIAVFREDGPHAWHIVGYHD